MLANVSTCQIDDLLYLARFGPLSELQSDLERLSNIYHCSPCFILLSAVDPSDGNTLLHMACANGHLDIINYLLTQLPPSDPYISSPNHALSTPLHWAALNGRFEAVKLLVGAGADMEAKNSIGKTAMQEAEVRGEEELAGWLDGQMQKEDGDKIEESLELNSDTTTQELRKPDIGDTPEGDLAPSE
ncbi:hypothetical protein MMC20_001045 [Loxospora ochrophaea]|nr:hypothetical protein [Loxospora ochrophaea]